MPKDQSVLGSDIAFWGVSQRTPFSTPAVLKERWLCSKYILYCSGEDSFIRAGKGRLWNNRSNIVELEILKFQSGDSPVTIVPASEVGFWYGWPIYSRKEDVIQADPTTPCHSHNANWSWEWPLARKEAVHELSAVVHFTLHSST